MKRCLNCRKTYEDNLTECPYCGYKPRSKVKTKRIEDTQEIDISSHSKGSDISSQSKKTVTRSVRRSHSFYLQSGERLNKRYSVINVMGFGAFGVAYECFDNNTQRNVVVKEYMPSYLVSRGINGRDVEPLSDEAEVTFSIGVTAFVDESKKLVDNEVSCVPRMLEYFRQNNTSYVVTELVHGESLTSIIRRKGKLSYHATITIITSVLQGLRKLNKIGIIHGDICPDNIIVDSEGGTYLLDYNLSDFNKNVYTQRDSGKLRAGYSALEMYYMNMEQGPWTDVYAAAATMYKMLTGVTVPSAIKRKTSDTLVPLSNIGVPITQGAEKAMLKALKVDYEKRTQNPEDFLNGLMGDGFDNLSEEKAVRTAPVKVEPKKKQRDGNAVLNTILTFLIIAIIGVVIWLFIAGVFTLPEPIMNLFSQGTTQSTDTDSESFFSDLPDYVGDFYENESDTEETETDTGNILDDILSTLSSMTEEFTSSEESSSEEEYWEESSEDDYYYSEDYTESSEYEEPSYWEDTSTESYYEHPSSNYEETSSIDIMSEIESSLTSVIDDVASGAGEYINSIIENF